MARERDDDDFDDRPARSGAKGPLDGMFANTNIVVLVIFGICCGLIAFILSLICYLTAKDPKAKSNAMLVMIIGFVMFVVGVVVQLAGLGAGLMGGR